MLNNKYQTWESEMEVPQLDSNHVSFVTVIFSSILGIILFITLLCKTGVETILKTITTEKRRNNTTSQRENSAASDYK